ncbi:MAG: pyridoxamine 5'-phosphate oxidase family protein [Lachnospiraceae bacterium]|nr:pyridoxamine 5'-phosphate oxidase family protein [Lachnospiraceae bacterium]
MRRSDREITDFDEITEIIRKCDVCRIALNDEDYPYILPLNFGMEVQDGKIVLYFHGANEGRKYELMEKNNKVSFEMDCGHRLIMNDEKMSCTMAYESVIGQGTIEKVPDEDKYDALVILMRQYHQEDFPFNRDVMPKTTVLKLTVSACTAKRRAMKA